LHGCHGSHHCFLQTLCLTARDICVCSPWAGYNCMSLPWVLLQHASCKEVYHRLRVPSHSSAFVTVQNNKYDKQCTYNVTMRHIHATTVAVENNKYYTFQKCECSLRYPACQAHVPYCHLWPDRLYSMFTHLINGNFFFGGGGELLNIKCVFWFYLQLMSETFLILRRNEQDTIKNVNWSSCKVPVTLIRF
jgi:hypothetical protein